MMIQVDPTLNLSGANLMGYGNVAIAGDQKHGQYHWQDLRIQSVQTYLELPIHRLE